MGIQSNVLVMISLNWLCSGQGGIQRECAEYGNHSKTTNEKEENNEVNNEIKEE